MKKCLKLELIFTTLLLWVSSACISSSESPQSVAITGENAHQSGRQVIRILNLDIAPTETITLKSTSTTPPTSAENNLTSHTATTSPTTPTSQESPSPTDTATPTIPSCNNRAAFLKHLNIGDYSSLNPGTTFAKFWQIMNVGTCTWTTGYFLVFSAGDQMGGPDEIQFTHNVEPGETVDLGVNLKTPFEPGTYTSQWMIKDEAGTLFGTGEFSNQPLVVIIVINPPNTKNKPNDEPI